MWMELVAAGEFGQILIGVECLCPLVLIETRDTQAVFSFKFQKNFPALAWRFKSRQNKKRIATAICKWRDESNEPN